MAGAVAGTGGAAGAGGAAGPGFGATGGAMHGAVLVGFVGKWQGWHLAPNKFLGGNLSQGIDIVEMSRDFFCSKNLPTPNGKVGTKFIFNP